jgi:hypothetical protein
MYHTIPYRVRRESRSLGEPYRPARGSPARQAYLLGQGNASGLGPSRGNPHILRRGAYLTLQLRYRQKSRLLPVAPVWYASQVA